MSVFSWASRAAHLNGRSRAGDRLGAARSSQDGSYGRRPPLTASVCCRDAVCGEGASDLAEAPTGCELPSDPVNDPSCQHRRTSGGPRRCARPSRFHVLGEEALELPDRDESLAPRRLHGADRRHNASVDRRDADAKSLGRLPAAVGEALDLLGLVELVSVREGPPQWVE